MHNCYLGDAAKIKKINLCSFVVDIWYFNKVNLKKINILIPPIQLQHFRTLPHLPLLKIFFPLYMDCGILVPWPGIKPMAPAVEVQSPNHCTIREVSLNSIFYLPFFTVKSLVPNIYIVILFFSIFNTKIETVLKIIYQYHLSTTNLLSKAPDFFCVWFFCSYEVHELCSKFTILIFFFCEVILLI